MEFTLYKNSKNTIVNTSKFEQLSFKVRITFDIYQSDQDTIDLWNYPT